MAEVFGAAAGALSVAALFNNCVECFEYVRLGRSFGRDYERCQLRLDVAMARLARWGEAVKVNDDPRFSTSSPTDKPTELTRSMLEEAALLFESARKMSKRYELVKDQQDLVVFGDKDMKPIGRALHNRLRGLARSRQKRTSLVRKTAWALYEGKALEKVVDQIADLVDDLEKLSPLEAVCHKLAEAEIEELKDEASLTTLQDAARGIDAALSDAAAQKMAAIAGRNSAMIVHTEESAKVQVGSVFTDATFHREIRVGDQTSNAVGRVSAKGQSAVMVGNTYGGRGFW